MCTWKSSIMLLLSIGLMATPATDLVAQEEPSSLPETLGSGLISTGTKVTYDKEAQRMVMEYYSSEPVRLMSVRKTD